MTKPQYKNDPIKDTLLARVYDIAIETPLQKANKLSDQLGVSVFLKREDLQPVKSFKIRGAYNKIIQLSDSERKKGVIAASAGNHAQGVALSAQKLGISATIVMPKTTPQIKIDAVLGYGAEVVLYGDSYSEAYEHCMKIKGKSGGIFIHPFDDPYVIAGQGTIGRELIEQNPSLTHVFVPTGGGGMLAGIAQYIKSLKPEVKIISVEPIDSNAMQASIKANERIVLDHVGIFADGVAVKQVGEYTFAIAKKYVDDYICVSADEICAAIKSVFEDTRSILEPAGALAVAGIQSYPLPKNANAVAICSGANMTFERLQYVAERTLIGSHKEAIYAISLSEKAGALKKFCQEIINGHNITEFNYRMQSRTDAFIFVGVSMSGDTDKTKFEKKLKDNSYDFTDLTDDDTAKEHMRHMIGGKSTHAVHEIFYSINFPERPGALQDFLDAIGNEYNISLFHYRGLGGDTGKVMIGFECANPKKLESVFNDISYEYVPLHSKSIKIFL